METLYSALFLRPTTLDVLCWHDQQYRLFFPISLSQCWLVEFFWTPREWGKIDEDRRLFTQAKTQPRSQGFSLLNFQNLEGTGNEVG